MILRSLCITALILLPATAHSGDLTVNAGDVISAVSGYQNGDYYRAVLVNNDGDADLYLFSRDINEIHLEATAPGIAVTGIGGSDAALTTTDKGALKVQSENIAIGRHRWQQTLTIFHRNGRFVVAGYTYSFYDTLAVDANGEVLTGECDVNLLTGKGFLDGKAIRTNLKALPVSEWSMDTSPPECSWE
ncbi:hypothetical protein [Labrenzia sp. PHM005]|uniref:hypothetical protein n=1 Tax=Labrenzia sp. PHM005 TaxID=2590016 RepID=UPI00114008D7|nr:hypothetical protein [Labrenzia sp. PHM005]QDG78454.1 hypothetical protein FJ695_22775 [Labrenzia sp. PHM005]